MFTIIITTTIHDINNIITYVAKKKEVILHSITITVFLLLLSLGFALIIPLIANFVSPKKSNGIKNSAYECGEKSRFDKNIVVNSEFFGYSLLFLMFSAQVVLLFPFALAFEKLTFFVFLQVLLFFAIIILSLCFAVQKNMLRFK